MDEATQNAENEVRFYNICKQTLQSAKMGQYPVQADSGKKEAFTSALMRENLGEQAKAVDINWGPDSGTPYTLLDPGVDALNVLIDKTVTCWQNWLDAGQPAGK